MFKGYIMGDNWLTNMLGGFGNAISGIGSSISGIGSSDIASSTPSTSKVMGLGLNGQAGMFNLGSPDLTPGSTTGAYGADGKGYGSLAGMSNNTPSIAGTAGTGLGFNMQTLTDLAPVALGFYNDSKNREIAERGQALNEDVYKTQKAAALADRDRSKTLQSRMGMGEHVSGKEYDEQLRS